MTPSQGNPVAEMEYRPGDLLDIHEPSQNASPRVLLLLNQPLQKFQTFEGIWNHASHRVCADGGANRLYDLLSGDLDARRKEFLPTAIVGDLDSLRDDAREYYSSQGVPITEDSDQESTDFGKAMQLISLLDQGKLDGAETVVLGGLGGRVDHGVGLLHEMLRESTKRPKTRLWLFSESSVSFVLRRGLSVIHLPLAEGHFTPNVGILPLYGPAVISTSGLEWDVKDWETQMGYRVSTSNHIVQDVVEVETNEEVLFTVERRR